MFKFMIFVACFALNAFLLSYRINANTTMSASHELGTSPFTPTAYPTIIDREPTSVDDVNKYIKIDSITSVSQDSGSSTSYGAATDEDVGCWPEPDSKPSFPTAVTPPVHPRGPQPPDTRLPYSVIFSGTGWKLIAESLSRAAAGSSTVARPPPPTPVVPTEPHVETIFSRAGWDQIIVWGIHMYLDRFLDWYQDIRMPRLGLPASVSCHMACTKSYLNLTSVIIIFLLLVIFLLLCVIFGDPDEAGPEQVEPEQVDLEEVDTDEAASLMDSEFDQEEKENYIPRHYAGEAWDIRSRCEPPYWVTRSTPSYGTWTGRPQMPLSEIPLSIEEQVQRQLLQESMLHTQGASERSSSMLMGPQAPSRFRTQAFQTPNQFRTQAPQAPNQFRTQAPLRDGAIVSPFNSPNRHRQLQTNQEQGFGYESLLRQALEETQTPRISPAVAARYQTPPPPPQTPPAVVTRLQTPLPALRRSQRLSSRGGTPFEEGPGNKGARTPRGPRNLRYL